MTFFEKVLFHITSSLRSGPPGDWEGWEKRRFQEGGMGRGGGLGRGRGRGGERKEGGPAAKPHVFAYTPPS